MEHISNNHILGIPESTNYWLVRADGGKYFEDFFTNNFIAIADNEISLERIKFEEEQNALTGITIENYKDLYTKVYPNMKPQQIAHAASRTMHFINSIQVNDLVLVPSQRSTHFILGIVVSDVYEASGLQLTRGDGDHYPLCDYTKRRNIIWLKFIDRDTISEKMYWMLSAHQSIFNLNEHSDHIDKLLTSIYVKGNKCHATVKVNTEKDIYLNDWLELYNEVKKHSGNESTEIAIKSNVQSPGLIDFITNVENLPTLLTAVGTLSGVLFTKVQIGTVQILGIIPYFFNEGPISRKTMKLDNQLKEVELEMKKAELINYKKENNISLPPISEKLEITPFNAGKVVEFRKPKDTLIQSGEAESEKK